MLEYFMAIGNMYLKVIWDILHVTICYILCSFGTFFQFWCHVGTQKNLATLQKKVRPSAIDRVAPQKSAFVSFCFVGLHI
jgi:hypothetical protein